MGDSENFRTERDILREIIEMYKDSPCLWDATCESYKDKKAKHEAILEIVDVWKIIYKDANPEFVKKKLENMRTTFFRERRRVIAREYAGERYKPNLWYYDDFLFLPDNIYNTKRVSLIEDENAETTLNRSSSKNKYNISLTERTPEKKRLKYAKSSDNYMSSEPDSIEYTALAMAHQLKEMNRKQRCIAEKLISDVIFHGKLDQLSVNSSINLVCNDSQGLSFLED